MSIRVINRTTIIEAGFKEATLITIERTAMKNLITLLSLVAVVFQGYSAGICHPRTSQVDFGLIEPLSTVTNAVAISNVGDTPLEIHRVRAGRNEGRSLSIQ